MKVCVVTTNQTCIRFTASGAGPSKGAVHRASGILPNALLIRSTCQRLRAERCLATP